MKTKINFKKYYDDVIKSTDLNSLPGELLPEKVFVWTMDISTNKDWDDFTGGQLVAHTYWENASDIALGTSFDARVDISELKYGNNPGTYRGMLNMNETITIYTDKYMDLDGKLVTLGDNIEDKYVPISYELTNVKGTNGAVFSGKMVLINIKRSFDDIYNTGQNSNIINIENGKLGETVYIPHVTVTPATDINPEKRTIGVIAQVNKKAKVIEVLLPNPAVTLGIDFITNSKNGSPLGDEKLTPHIVSTKPKTLPENPLMCILPTQWAIPSLDNYGWTHPGDSSNTAKVLAATQALGQVANTGFGLANVLKDAASKATGIGSAAVGMAQKFFGDKGTLANSAALTPTIASGEGDNLKFFIQGDALESDVIGTNGYIDMNALRTQHDYLEMNQSGGQMGKYGKSMSPSMNNGFNDFSKIRALGLDSMDKTINMPWLATPYVGASHYNRFLINADKINDFMKIGVPRLNVNSGPILRPMQFPNTWDVYIRNMFFRPDPYSFWNWPAIMPAEIGAYDVVKPTSISYDVTSAAVDIFKTMIDPTESTAASQIHASYWNKSIEIDKLSKNDLYDPNKTFSSFRFEFDNPIDNLYQMQMAAFTSSQVVINLLDEHDKIIRTHTFNSQGTNVGTSASWGTVVQF